jgi:3-oxoacyl-[acyl-carrier protein] reductase
MDLQLNGKRALVTGGTRGIGRAIVETLLDEGTAVAFCARSSEEVSAAEAALAGRAGPAIGAQLNVGNTPALTDWVTQSASHLGGIDILISNVSAMATPDTPDNWSSSFQIDLMGTVNMVNAALPHLEVSEAASIVTVSSVSAREIDFFAGPYGALKAAVVHYTQGLAYRLAAKGIRANTVSPGNTFFEGGSWDRIKHNRPDLYAATVKLNPTGRLGTPAEIARAVVFLASPASSFTSGTNLVVDGALTRGVQL